MFPSHAHDVASLLRTADSAMYEAKRTGERAWQMAR
jgi:GGDEF domain-containing protein